MSLSLPPRVLGWKYFLLGLLSSLLSILIKYLFHTNSEN